MGHFLDIVEYSSEHDPIAQSGENDVESDENGDEQWETNRPELGRHVCDTQRVEYWSGHPQPDEIGDSEEDSEQMENEAEDGTGGTGIGGGDLLCGSGGERDGRGGTVH